MIQQDGIVLGKWTLSWHKNNLLRRVPRIILSCGPDEIFSRSPNGPPCDATAAALPRPGALGEGEGLWGPAGRGGVGGEQRGHCTEQRRRPALATTRHSSHDAPPPPPAPPVGWLATRSLAHPAAVPGARAEPSRAAGRSSFLAVRASGRRRYLHRPSTDATRPSTGALGRALHLSSAAKAALTVSARTAPSRRRPSRPGAPRVSLFTTAVPRAALHFHSLTSAAASGRPMRRLAPPV